MSVTEADWPLADDEVRLALEAAYRDGSWGRYDGPNCAALVDDLRLKFSREHVLLCSSGTIGVELALRGCGVTVGDEVILAGYDFPGNFRAIEAIGARPLLVDVDRDNWCLSASELQRVQSDRVRALIVSHLHGGLADMASIVSVARQRGWAVVEDACQQPGAWLAGRAVGGWGDAGVLSFGGSKLLTAGRGGAVMTSDPKVHQRMKVYADRGNQAFPLSELQAAVLRPQLAKLDERNQIRRDRVATILQITASLGRWLRPVQLNETDLAAYYKFAWSFIPAEEQPELREELLGSLHKLGISINAGFRGFAKRSERRCQKIGELKQSKQLSQSTLLLHHPLLLKSKKAAQQVGQAIDDEVRRFVS